MHQGEPGANPLSWQAGPSAAGWGTKVGDVTLHYHLLPFSEQTALYQAGNGLQLFSYVGATKVWTVKLNKVFRAPNDASPDFVTINYGWLEGGANTDWATTSYAGNYQVFGKRGGNAWSSWDWSTGYKIETIPDGSSQTIFFAEKMGSCSRDGAYGSLLYHGGWEGSRPPMFAGVSGVNAKFQVTPTQANCDRHLATAFSAGGIMVSMGDGSVRSVTSNVSSATWGQAVDPADGGVLGSDF